MFCSKCGTPNEDGAPFCSNCGAALEAGEQPAVEPAEAVVAVAEETVDAGTARVDAGMPAEPAQRQGAPAAPPRIETARLNGPELTIPRAAALPAPAAGPRKLLPETAFLIEFLAGIFGLLGFGYLAAGKTNDGIVRLVVWLVYTVLAWVVIGLQIQSVIGLVLTAICLPIQLVLQIGVPLWSANKLKRQLIAEG